MTGLVLETLPSDRDVAALRSGLRDFNLVTTGIFQSEQLAIFLRNERREIEGGIYAFTWGGCCEIDLLWIAEARRGRGEGRTLVVEIENAARARGCHRLMLTTHSFQARPFYERLGFEVAGEVSDYPKGHSYFLMTKSLS